MESVQEEPPSGPPNARRSPKNYVHHLSKLLDQLDDAMRDRTSQAASRRKRYYDLRANPQRFEIGDHVLLFSPRIHSGQKRKFRKPWTGPYQIVEQLSTVTYRIQHLRRRDVVHVVHEDRLKHCPDDLRLPACRLVSRHPPMSTPPPMQPNSWIRTYCEPDARTARLPQLLLLDPSTPSPRQPPSPRPSPPVVERAKRLTRKPTWLRDYVTHV
uniref:Integrase zinc-binding domain-containing protein n=1 Tax=Trichuris muris TaxID=70415 RepID=A0A5S6QFT1_TRIMR